MAFTADVVPVTTLAGSLGQMAAIAIVLIGIVAIATSVLNRRRRDVWREFARQHGLTFDDSSGSPRISGDHGGRIVEVDLNDSSSDRDVAGVEVVQMSVGLRRLPRGMTVRGVPGLIGDLAALSEERIRFEPAEFHRDVIVKGDELRAREYWNARRQQRFLQLVHSAPCDHVAMHDGMLNAELREIVSDGDRLEELLDQLLDAASDLDGAVDVEGV